MISSETLKGINVKHSLFGAEIKTGFKVSTDSRSIQAGDMFIALVGEKFDGFSYLEDVIAKGASSVVFQHKIGRRFKHLVKKYPEVTFIETNDTLVFLQELAREHKRQWQQSGTKTTIALTGSNGKTTHKEMLKHLLSSIFPGKVLATKGNLNNHIGVPLTLLDLLPEHDIAIVEMGMNHRHEIMTLCKIAEPSHGLITNIGQAHIGFLGSMTNIYFEKSDLYRWVKKFTHGFGMFVVNADDDYLRLLESSTGLTTFGEKYGDIKVNVSQNEIHFNFRGQAVAVKNTQIQEEYNLRNLVCTMVLAMKLFPDKVNEIAKAACLYQQPSMNRSEWVNHIFLDAYNANPSSMKASLNSFIKIIEEKSAKLDECFFVMGDMNELGDFAEELHAEMANYVQSLGIKNVVFVGRYKEYYLKGNPNALGGFLEKEDFLKQFPNFKSDYKWIFIKGSRSVKLETLLS